MALHKALTQRFYRTWHMFRKRMPRACNKADSDSLFDAPDSYECSCGTEGCSKGTSHTCILPKYALALCKTEGYSVLHVTHSVAIWCTENYPKFGIFKEKHGLLVRSQRTVDAAFTTAAELPCAVPLLGMCIPSQWVTSYCTLPPNMNGG